MAGIAEAGRGGVLVVDGGTDAQAAATVQRLESKVGELWQENLRLQSLAQELDHGTELTEPPTLRDLLRQFKSPGDEWL